MKKLKWTNGFCNNCGRFIKHFRKRKVCPECNKIKPLKDNKSIQLKGVDYVFGFLLGKFTCSRFSTSRLFEKFLLFLGIKPRNGEEITVLFYLILSIIIYTCSYLWNYNSFLSIIFIIYTVYRSIEIVAIRLRILLYDKRVITWKHASYTRSLILLSINLLEILFLFAAVYLTQLKTDFQGNIFYPILYSLTGESEFLILDRKDEILISILQKSTNYILLGIGLSSLINMMGTGKEHYK